MPSKWLRVLPNDDGIRPAGAQDECLYCGCKVGEFHKRDCVIVNKTVKVRYSFEIEIEQPHYWDKERIEDYHNNGSWCADNAIDELERDSVKNGCLCGRFTCEVVDMGDDKPFMYDNEKNRYDLE